MIFAGEFRAGKNQRFISAVKQYIGKTGDTSVKLYLPGAGKKLEGMHDTRDKARNRKERCFSGLR